MTMKEKSIQDIDNDLKSIARKLALQGESVDLAIELCKYSIYNRNVIAYTLGNESNPDTARNMNSIIRHSIMNSYSAPRGCNCELIITLIRVSDRVVPRFSKLHSYQNYKIYNLDEIEPGALGSVVKVRCIITTKIYDKVEPAEMTRSAHYLRFPTVTNVSDQTYLVKDTAEGKTETIDVTTSMTEHLDYHKPLMLTDYDYSIRVNFNEKVLAGNPNDDYKVVAFEYSPYMVPYSSSEIESMDGVQYYNKANLDTPFMRGLSIRGFTIDDIEVVPAVLREDLIDVAHNCKYNLTTMSRIRGMNDVERVFKEVFRNLIYDCYSVKVPKKNQVIIYYILRTTSPRDISRLEWDLFKSNNIIKFIPAEFSIIRCTRIDYAIDISITASSYIDKEPFIEYINSLNYSLNRTITSAEIVTQIARINPNVKYSEVSMRRADGTDTDRTKIVLKDIEYLNFSYIGVNIEVQ